MRAGFLFIGLVIYGVMGGQVNTTRLPLKHIKLSDGLISKHVLSLHQDKKGFIWIGTTDGLQRYDGKYFKTFLHEPGNSNSLTHNQIHAIRDDKYGRIWITTKEGLSIYDPSTGIFKRIYSGTDAQLTVKSDAQHQIIFDSSGDKAFVATNDGLLVFNTFDLSFQVHREPPSLTSNEFYSLYLLDTQYCLVNTSVRYILFNIGKKKFNTSEDKTPYKSLLTALNGVLAGKSPGGPVIKDSKENFWFSVWTPGFYTYNSLSGKTDLIDLNPAIPTDSWQKMTTNYILDRSQNIWSASVSGLYRLHTESGLIDHYFHSENDANSLLSNKITSVMQDRDGNIWAGTELGISICSSAPEYFSYPLTEHTGKLAEMNAFLAAKDSSIWLGTYSAEGLFHFDKNLRLLHRYNSFGPEKNFEHNAVWAINETRSGKILVCRQTGFSIIDPFVRKVDNFPDIPVFHNRGISNAVEDKDGKIWVSLHRGTLVHLDPSSRLSVSFPLGKILKVLYRKDDFLLLRMLKENKQALYAFNTQTKKLYEEPYHFFRSAPAGSLRLIGDVWTCLEGRDKIYMGTSTGLWVWDNKLELFSNYSRANGLINDNIQGMYEDDSGLLWIATKHGLSLFNPGTKSFRSFSESEGLNELDFGQGEFLKLPGGDLLTGNTKGPVIINRKNIGEAKPVVTPTITSIKIGNSEIPIPEDNRISISWRENNVMIHFASLDFLQSHKIRYAHKLEGFDKNWIETGTQNAAIYTNLPGGHYVLQVKASNEEGVWNDNYALVELFVSTPFYKSLWFFTGIAGIIIITLYAFYQARIKRILEMQNFRNNISRDLHDEVGSTLSSISMLSTSAKSSLERKNLQPAEDMIEKIKTSSQRILETMDDIIWTINPQKDSMQSLVGRMREVIHELQDVSAIRFDFKTDPQAEALNLPMKTKKNFYLIFKEALTNSVKHSGCTEVRIELKKESHALCLELSDNGKGFASHKGYDGNGLKNMQQRAEESGANLKIESVYGEGTKLSLSLKLQHGRLT